MKFALPTVYPITDRTVSGLPHPEQVRRLIDGGATIIQIRDKKSSSREFFQSAKECVAYARERGVRIIINDRADIAMTAGADGVHCGQDDLSPSHVRRLLGDRAVIGYSTHTLSQAVEAAKLPVDYIAYGPVFPTFTKENPDPVVGLNTLSRVKESIGDMPLVAIGGINETNLAAVLRAGADSGAMIGGLFTDASEIAATMARLLSISRTE